MAEKTAIAKPYVVTSVAGAEIIGGRRDFITFRDMGVKEVTGGGQGAVVMDAKKAMERETGWHYHECDFQLIYILRGWSEIMFEDGQQFRVEADSVIFIPGGVRHNETRTSDDMRALEVTTPADMRTVAVDPPVGLAG